jgi:O-antigen biosynthesis protein
MSHALRGAGEPAASIVLVTNGGRRWTELALQALAEHTTCRHEVIVVDNASSEATPRRLRERQDIEVVYNAGNEGFGPACNQGAAKARGQYLVFLKSDTVVHPGWLEPLVAVLDADPAVGAVGPRFVYPDGRLRGAGTLIARDGTVLQYGDGAAAHALQFRFPRTVDCCSGACLAVRRRAFEAVGGFDPAWAAAYYEDIDLCLRLREAGHRLIFEPAATVTDLRYGSGSFEARELSVDHRKWFVERWGHHLTGRPASLDRQLPVAIMTARDAPARGRVLVLDDRLDPSAVNRSSAVVSAVLTALPDAPRVTWRTDALAAGRLDPGPWLRRGVEFVEDPSPDWLADRRFSLDVIFSGVIADPRLARALDEAQPQALRVSIDAVALDAVEDRLADAGLWA